MYIKNIKPYKIIKDKNMKYKTIEYYVKYFILFNMFIL